MTRTNVAKRGAEQRAIEAVRRVLPRLVKARVAKRSSEADLIVGDQSLQVRWVGEGSLRDARLVLNNRLSRPDIVVARRLSPGAREALSDGGIGWVDETGAAEIAIGSIVVSRTGQPQKPRERPKWTTAVIAVAEALLCATKATVSATAATTGLSAGSCTKALRVLTDLGLLETRAERGRNSARELSDPDRLLEAYATEVAVSSSSISLQVGVVWRDSIAGLVETGEKWSKTKLEWAATGAAAASVIAPYLQTVTSVEVYVDTDNILGLEAIAETAGLRPIEGGRLTLRPFPTAAVRRLAESIEGLRVAPWPRVYADLRTSGVRGEEAAEHLRDVVRDR